MLIILLRNICPAEGLANGTRLVIRQLSRRVICAEIITGSRVGALALIPRLTMISSDDDLPFVLMRLQFPVRPAFAMSINKSQGANITSCWPLFAQAGILPRSALRRIVTYWLTRRCDSNGCWPGKQGWAIACAECRWCVDEEHCVP